MRRKVSAVIIFWLSASFLWAQQADTSRVHAQARQLLDLAQRAHENSRLDSAILYAEKAMGQFDLLADQDGACEALNLQGKYLTTQGKIPAAIPVLEASLERSRNHLPQPHRHTAQSLNNLGFCYGRVGRDEESLAAIEGALALRQEMFGEYHADVARSYFILSHYHGNRGRFEMEGELLQKVLDIYVKLDDPNNPDLEDAYNNLGVWYSRQGDYASARECYEIILESMHQSLAPDNYRFAAVYNNLGNVYQRMGEFYKALKYIHKARSLNEKYYPGSSKLGVNWANVGNLNMAIGDLETARLALEKAVAIDRSGGKANQLGTGMSLVKLGECQNAMEEYEAALETLAEADNLLQSSPEKMKAGIGLIKILETKSLMRMGRVAEGEATFGEGIATIVSAKGIRHADVAEAYHMFAKLQFELGEYAEAIRSSQKGLSGMLENFEAEDESSLPPTGTVYNWRNLRNLSLVKAQSFFARARTQATPTPDLEAAWDNIQLALQLTDSMRIHFSDNASRKYMGTQTFFGYELGMEISHALYRQTGDEKYMDAALEVAEKSKGFLLSMALRNVRARQFGIVPDSLLKRERYLKTSLAKYDERLQRGVKNPAVMAQWDSTRFALQLEYDALQTNLAAQFPEVYQSGQLMQETTVAQLRKELEEDEVLLEYFAGDSAYFLLAIHPGQAEYYRVPRTLQLNREMTALQAALTEVPDPAADQRAVFEKFSQPAHRVYAALLAPALADHPGRRLVIVPDGPLGRIPFEVLLTQTAGETSDFAALPYLFRKAQIRYAYAARFLRNPEPPQSGREQLLAIAPTFEGAANESRASGPAALQHTAAEVATITDLLGGTSLLGAQATESKFKASASDYRLLHLASHFVLNDSSPMASGILFAADTSTHEDGILHLYELFGLPLNAEMAVLSACNTGSGKHLRGEGQLSLAWGFRMAGCPSLVVSLWNANDQATAGLMAQFYESVDAGLSKDAALNQARSNYLASADNYRAHPYFWSQFVLVGNGDPLQARTSAWWWWLLAILGLGVISGLLRRKLA